MLYMSTTHAHSRTLGASVSTGQATLKKLLMAALQSKGSEPDPMCTSQPASCFKRTEKMRLPHLLGVLSRFGCCQSVITHSTVALDNTG